MRRYFALKFNYNSNKLCQFCDKYWWDRLLLYLYLALGLNKVSIIQVISFLSDVTIILSWYLFLRIILPYLAVCLTNHVQFFAVNAAPTVKINSFQFAFHLIYTFFSISWILISKDKIQSWFEKPFEKQIEDNTTINFRKTINNFIISLMY